MKVLPQTKGCGATILVDVAVDEQYVVDDVTTLFAVVVVMAVL